MLYTNKDHKWPDNLLQVSIVRDYLLSNPCDDDGSWQVDIGGEMDDYAELAKQGFAYYFAKDSYGFVSFSSGSRSTGIVYWPHPADDMGAVTLEDRRKDCEAFLKCYADYIYGNGLGYVIKDSNGNEESCFGFYKHDLEYLLSEVKALLPGTKRMLIGSKVNEAEVLQLCSAHPDTTIIQAGIDHFDYIDLKDLLN